MEKIKKKRNKIIFIVIVLLIVLIIGFGISKLIPEGNAVSSDEIAVIQVFGAISFSDSGIPFQGRNANAQTIIDNIEKAKAKNVKAVVFEIDSPGGTVVASKQVAEAIRRLNKPTVAVIRETGASGAYWIAASTDKIVADELSITGSIGVISSYLEFSDLLNKYGVEYARLVSGKYKDIGSPLKDLTDEEKELLQKKLDLVDEFFVGYVKERRNLTNEEVNRIKTGEFFLGKEAKDLHLIDYTGNKEFAIKLAKDIGNVKDAKVTEFKEKKTLLDLFSSYTSEAFYYMGRGIGTEISNMGVKKGSNLDIIA